MVLLLVVPQGASVATVGSLIVSRTVNNLLVYPLPGAQNALTPGPSLREFPRVTLSKYFLVGCSHSHPDPLVIPYHTRQALIVVVPRNGEVQPSPCPSLVVPLRILWTSGSGEPSMFWKKVNPGIMKCKSLRCPIRVNTLVTFVIYIY